MNKCVYEGFFTWVGRKGTADFWDEMWMRSFEKKQKVVKIPLFVKRIIEELPKGSRVLEAGCGAGRILTALIRDGYLAEGVDYADRSIYALKRAGLPVRKMDVRDLKYQDDEFAAYISLGVIEHFFDHSDVDKVVDEAIRVVRHGGLILFSIPYLNVIRKYKAEKIKNVPIDVSSSTFWQRAYSDLQLAELFKDRPLKLVKKDYCNPVKGIGDEINFLSFIKKVRLFAKLLLVLDTYTPFFSWGAHMVSVAFINDKEKQDLRD